MRASSHSLFYALGVLLLASTLGPSPVAAADPLQLVVPSPIYQCHTAVFSWTGGTPPYIFSYAPPNGAWTSMDSTSDTSTTFKTPNTGTFGFMISDAGSQSDQKYVVVQAANDCGKPVPTTTSGHVTTIIHVPTSSATGPVHGPPSSSGESTPTGAPDSTASTNTPGSPTSVTAPSSPSNPSDPYNPSATASPGPNSPPQSSAGGPGVTTDSAGNTIPVVGQTGPNGQVTTVSQTGGGDAAPSQPTGTAAPIRNTQADEPQNVSMSPQAKGAIIGTILGGFALFLAFLLFRWRRKHQNKHRPIAILPRINSSGEDLMVPVVPPMSTPSYHQLGYPITPASTSGSTPPSPLLPAPSFTRNIPPTKQPLTYSTVPAQQPSNAESDYDHAPPLSQGTWNTSHTGSSSHVNSVSITPVRGPEAGVDAHPYGPLISALQQEPPRTSTSNEEPVSLQHLIGRELDNIYSQSEHPNQQLPPIPARSSARPPQRGLRLVNDAQASSSSGSGSGSGNRFASGKQPRLTPVNRVDNDSASPSTTEGRGGVQLTRGDMEYLADLVAARLTHNPQRGEEVRSEVGLPPPSYA